MKKSNEFGCQFIIDTGDKDPNIFTDIIGLKPNSIKQKGTPFVNGRGDAIPGKFLKSNLWILDTGKLTEKEGFYLNEAISLLIDNLSKNEDKLKRALLEFPNYHLLCYAYFYETNPYFFLDKKLSDRLAKFEMTVEFDLYCLGGTVK